MIARGRGMKQSGRYSLGLYSSKTAQWLQSAGVQFPLEATYRAAFLDVPLQTAAKFLNSKPHGGNNLYTRQRGGGQAFRAYAAGTPPTERVHK